MDGLYLFEGFFLITEVKNFKNKILLNEANQLIQLQEEGSEEVFDNPLTQVELQKEQLIQLLDKHGYPTIPIETLVVFTHKKVHLTFNHPDLITSQQLPARLKRITQKYPTKLLQRNELYHLGRKLISLHEERGSAFINPNDKIFPKIKRGVFCNRCKPIIMRRIYGSWECPKCKKRNSLAHLVALEDFYYLFGHTITNRQARWFLCMDSVYTTSRLLQSLGMKRSGITKNARYDLSSLFKR